MKNVRFLLTGLGVGLCLCALAKADDDEIRTTVRPVVVKRLIIFTGHQDRVICVRPAYPVQSVVPVNRPYWVTAKKTGRHSSESPAVVNQETSNNVVKTANTSHSDSNQQKADKDNKPVDTDRKTDAQQSEGDDALDHLTAQAQREQELPLAEPGGIQHR